MEEYIKIIQNRLSPARYEHSINVSKSAMHLAKKYGANVEKAQIAGLLHDVTKEAKKEEQFSLISRMGIKLSPIEIDNEKLWHSISGAAYLSLELGINDPEIINAVRYHTTGRKGMSLLEKIVFIADMISDDRSFEGVETVRRFADENLDKAVWYSTVLSIEWLIEKKAAIAPATLDAYNDTVMKN